MPSGASDGQQVNIPAPMVIKLCKDAFGKRTDLIDLAGRVSARPCPPASAEKNAQCFHHGPYRKPTQVGELSILRRKSEPSLRNSAI